MMCGAGMFNFGCCFLWSLACFWCCCRTTRFINSPISVPKRRPSPASATSQDFYFFLFLAKRWLPDTLDTGLKDSTAFVLLIQRPRPWPSSVEWFLILRAVDWWRGGPFVRLKILLHFFVVPSRKKKEMKWKKRQTVWSFFNICWHAIVIESGWVLKWAFSAKRETSHFHSLSLSVSLWLMNICMPYYYYYYHSDYHK